MMKFSNIKTSIECCRCTIGDSIESVLRFALNQCLHSASGFKFRMVAARNAPSIPASWLLGPGFTIGPALSWNIPSIARVAASVWRRASDGRFQALIDL